MILVVPLETSGGMLSVADILGATTPRPSPAMRLWWWWRWWRYTSCNSKKFKITAELLLLPSKLTCFTWNLTKYKLNIQTIHKRLQSIDPIRRSNVRSSVLKTSIYGQTQALRRLRHWLYSQSLGLLQLSGVESWTLLSSLLHCFPHILVVRIQM